MPSATTSSAARSSAGLRDFEAIAAQRHEQPQLAHALDVLRGDLAEALREVLGGDDFGGLGLERRGHGVAQPEQPLGQAVRSAEQPLDRGEVEAVGLQVEDQAQARDVVGAVVADARAHLGRGQQPARVVVADVPHRHPDLGRELLDRQVAVQTCRPRPDRVRRSCRSLPSSLPSQDKDTTIHVTSFEVASVQVVNET